MHETFGLLFIGKASNHSMALPSFFSSSPMCSVFMFPFHQAVRPTLLRPIDIESLTCAHTFGVRVPYTRRGVRRKPICTRVDSEGQKNCSPPCPARGSNPGSSDFDFDSVPLSYVPLCLTFESSLCLESRKLWSVDVGCSSLGTWSLSPTSLSSSSCLPYRRCRN